MGQTLVIESLTVRTDTAERTYPFSEGVTAVSGPIGSGKSSLLELIKYSLGGRAQVMPAVRDNVTTLILRLRAGEEHLELTRALGARLIDVVDLKLREGKTTWATTNRRNMRRAGQELLAAVGLPRDIRVPRRRTRPTGETVPVSFFDVYRYLYLDQNSIDKSVVGHDDPNLDVKRRAVFQLLYGLTNPRVLELAAERGRYSQIAEHSRAAARNVLEFLRSTGDRDPLPFSVRREEVERRRDEAAARLSALRSATVRTQPSMQLARHIAQLRSDLDRLELDRQGAQRDVQKDRSVLAQLELDEQALRREGTATASLTGLEFTRCPRCLQSVENREVDLGHCSLCCQPEPGTIRNIDVEVARIRDQRAETVQLLDEDLVRLEELSDRAGSVREQLAAALDLAGERLEQPGDPLLDEVADASREVAEASAELSSVVAAQARWSSYEQLNREAEEAESTSRRLAEEEARLRLEIEENSTRLTDLSHVFNDILASLRDPWYREAYVSKDNYLPVVDGEQFDMLSVGGARKTLVNLAYHLANLSMAISERDAVLMPTLLVVDSPRKNVGAGALDASVVEAVYRRLRTLQDASGSDFQIIMADNELPLGATDWIRGHIRLDYDNPLVPGISHPSRLGEEVESLGGDSTVELE